MPFKKIARSPLNAIALHTTNEDCKLLCNYFTTFPIVRLRYLSINFFTLAAPTFSMTDSEIKMEDGVESESTPTYYSESERNPPPYESLSGKIKEDRKHGRKEMNFLKRFYSNVVHSSKR